MENELELWAAGVFQPAPEEDLSDLPVETHWARVMKTVLPVPELDEMLGLPRTKGFLFYGPAGTGKRSLARAMAGSLAASGYRFAEVGGDVSREQLRYLLEREEQSVFLLADTPGERLMEELARALDRCAGEDRPVIAVVVQEELDRTHPALRRRLTACRFDLPTLEERTAFYQETLGAQFPLKKGLTAKDLAIASEGLKLRDLSSTLYLSQLYLKERALATYKRHYSMAESAMETGELCLDLEAFRAIVSRVKEPEKEKPQPIQIIQTVAAPAAPPAEQPKEEPKSETDRLRSAKNASHFFDML